MSEKEREFEEYFGNDELLDPELMLREQMDFLGESGLAEDYAMGPVGDLPPEEDTWAQPPQPTQADLFAQELFVEEFGGDDETLTVPEELSVVEDDTDGEDPVTVEDTDAEKKDEGSTFWGCVILVVIAVAVIALIWWLIASGILGAIFSFLFKAAIVIGLICWVISWFTD